MRKLFLLSILLVTGLVPTFAQLNLTFYNYPSVAQSGLLNPALPSRQGFTLGLVDAHITNYIPGTSLYNIFRSDETADQTIARLMSGNFNLNNINNNNSLTPLFLGLRIRKSYFSAGLSLVNDNQVSIPKDLLKFAYYGNVGSELFGQKLDFGGMKINSTIYSSVNFGYSRDITDKLTVGVRGKYIIGFGNISVKKSEGYLVSDSGNANAYSLSAGTNYELNMAGYDRFAGLIDSSSNKNFNTFDYLKSYKSNPVGRGFGIDIGVNYKYSDKLSFSGSILDLGGITWNESKTYSRNATFYYEGVVFEPGDTQTFDEKMNNLVDSVGKIFKPEESPKKYRTSLNPKVYLGTSYRPFNSGSIDLVLAGEFKPGFFIPAASVAYTQRVWRALDLRVNYNIYRNVYSNVGFGFSGYLGPISIYTIFDNVLAAVNYDQTRFTSVRVGMNINIGGRFDRDNDGVPDRKDKCKKVPGLVKFKGCPDFDEDGVPDTEDECINEKGTIKSKGCPDKDGDGVADKKDSCVNEKGAVKLNGCPDRDLDGIADYLDLCPDDSGLIATKGCPDKDGDGIVDKADKCPDQRGPLTTMGCPDMDLDSVPDAEDECSATPGPKALKGCPDLDKDGIINKLDSCLGEAGPASTFGCPDSDGDNIPDKYDVCPTEAGKPENNGCPVKDTNQVILNEEEKKVLREAFSNLEFETGTSKISESSLASLAELAELLIARPEYKLEISGHTDNVGNAKSNQKLSQDRATAVKKFLTGKGVQTERIKAQGFGSKKPVADNKTPEGRQKNRRVEFKIVK